MTTKSAFPTLSALICTLAIVAICVAHAADRDALFAKIVGSLRYIEPYSIEGLGVGMPVAPNSRAYRRYKCRPSEQYESSVTCRFSETKGGVSKVITILHLYNNIVTHINKSVLPAFFNKPEIQNEIERLSSRFGRPPRIYTSPAGLIATWGEIELQPLTQDDLGILAQSRDNNPNQGFLVDYLMNFHRVGQSWASCLQSWRGRGLHLDRKVWKKWKRCASLFGCGPLPNETH